MCLAVRASACPRRTVLRKMWSAKKVLCAVLFLANTQVSHGFAAWLVERELACYTMVRELDEIIMNYPVKPVKESAYPDEVYIEVVEMKSEQPVEISVVDGRRLAYVKESSGGGQDFLLKLVTPADLKDLQYVMDIVVLPERDEDEEQQKGDEDGDGMAGKFTGGSTGCADSRAHGRAGDAGLTLHLDVPSSLFSHGQSVEHAVEVVAIWACGHEAVTLTHPVLFVPEQRGEGQVGDADSLALTHQTEQQRVKDNQLDDDSVSLPDGVDQDVILALKEHLHPPDNQPLHNTNQNASEQTDSIHGAGNASEQTDPIIEPEQTDPIIEPEQTDPIIEPEQSDPIIEPDNASLQAINNNDVNNDHHHAMTEDNGSEQMDAIIEGLNRVEQAVQNSNSSPEKMGVIMESLNEVEALIQNNGIEEMDAIMDGLKKVEYLIEHDSPEEMDSIMKGVDQHKLQTTTSDETRNKLRRTIGGDKLLDTPTHQHETENNNPKPKHKKHHRPDPLDTPIRRFRKKYDEANFGFGSYSAKSHLLGICVLLSGNVTLFPLLFALKRRYSKGRLD